MVRWLSGFFNYFDRCYLSSRNPSSLKEEGLVTFRNLVFNKVCSKVCAAALSLLVIEEGTALVIQAEYAASNKIMIELHDKYLTYVTGCFMNDSLFRKVKCVEVFKGFYETERKHRRLTWVYSLGTCNIIGKFKAKPLELVVTPYQAGALLLFNFSGRLSSQDIKTQLNLSDDDVIPRPPDDENAPTTVIDELTLAQTLIEIKAAKPKVVTTAATTTTTRPRARGVVVQEPSEFRTTTSSSQASQPSKTKDKGKAIMIKPEVPLKRKDQAALNEEMARNLEAQLQAELIKEEKMARKKVEEANIALIESWENTQAMMEADRLLAERLQTKEQEELTDQEKAKLFMEIPRPPDDEKKKVVEGVEKDRTYAIDAALVRVMKSRKKLGHQQLT
ncbi:cullin-1-like protein isoform X3 [Tanacetum coccineum]